MPPSARPAPSRSRLPPSLLRLPQRRQWPVVGGFLLLLVVAAAAVWLVLISRQQTALVAHTLEVRASAARLLTLVQEAETGQRGYLLTGDEAYLRPYREGSGSAAQALAELAAQTTDNPVQQRELASLKGRVDEKLAELAETVALRRDANDAAAALRVVRTGRGERLMQEIRASVERVQAEETRLLAQRDAAADRTGLALLVVSLGGIGLVIGLALQSIAGVRRSTQLLERSRGDLQVANDDLERVIEERTAELRAERAQAEEVAALRTAILGQLGEGVIVTDGDGRITFVNAAATRLHGVARLDVEPEHYSETYQLFTEDGRPHPFEELPLARAVMKGETVTEARWRIRRPDGSEVLAMGDARPVVAADGTRIGSVLTLRDDTQREAAERLQRRLNEALAEQAAELIESNEELQRYAYIVSHDLRAPLVNVMGFTSELEAVQEEIRAELKDSPKRDAIDRDLKESLSFIKAAITKMEGLIAAILKLSREGRRTLRPEPLDLAALAQGLADAIRHQTESANAVITIAPDLPALTADRLAVEQILGNLLDNAVKYLDPSRPGTVEVTGEERGSRVVLRVRDNGRGIAPNDHGRVFELFRRAGAQDRPGEGIGLAHVKALVRGMGGRIELASTPGTGTTFTVVLPRSAPLAGVERQAAE